MQFNKETKPNQTLTSWSLDTLFPSSQNSQKNQTQNAFKLFSNLQTSLIDWLIDYNGMSTDWGLFYT